MEEPWRRFESGIISCAVWKKKGKVIGQNVNLLTAAVERRCKAKDGSWRAGSSFDRSDIPRVIYNLQQAREAMTEEEDVQVELDEEMLQLGDERLPQD